MTSYAERMAIDGRRAYRVEADDEQSRRYYLIATGPATDDVEILWLAPGEMWAPPGVRWLIGSSGSAEHARKALADHVAFSRSFWDGKLAIIDAPTTARIEGRHYQIAPEGGSRWSRGFGGQRFVIHFLDGRTVTTSNLWSQGTIPSDYRERLPDNARFCTAPLECHRADCECRE